MATTVHPYNPDPDDPAWKDNAYLAFWDTGTSAYGTVHVSTSPNDPGTRRARFSLHLAGQTVEIIEDLPPGSFTSESISFGLDGTIAVDHPDLTVLLGNAPLWTPTDYSLNNLIPPLVPDKPYNTFNRHVASPEPWNTTGAHGPSPRTGCVTAHGVSATK